MRRLIFIPLLFSSASAADVVITYDEHIKPIFREHCLKCHGEDEQKADLNLATFATAIKGGSGGEAVVAGRASASLLFEAITAADDGERMPPKKPPIPEAQVELIRQWIQGGLRETSASLSMVAARDTSFTPASPLQLDGPPPMPESLPEYAPPALKHLLPVIAIATSPRAPLLAVAGHQYVALLDAATRKPLGNLPFPEGQPNVIRFSLDGRVLMVAGGKPVQSGSVVLFDVKTGNRLASFGDETDAVMAADLSPDQQLVALGGSGKVVKVYGTADGKLRYKLEKHTDWVTCLAFSPDGKGSQALIVPVVFTSGTPRAEVFSFRFPSIRPRFAALRGGVTEDFSRAEERTGSSSGGMPPMDGRQSANSMRTLRRGPQAITVNCRTGFLHSPLVRKANSSVPGGINRFVSGTLTGVP